MSRAELWKALTDATDAVQAAGDEYTRASTPQALAAVNAAFHEYVQRLYPVIGHAEAFRYEASLATYQKAIEHAASEDEEQAAERAFEAAQAALDAALERARAHDNEPDEKGGA